MADSVKGRPAAAGPGGKVLTAEQVQGGAWGRMKEGLGIS